MKELNPGMLLSLSEIIFEIHSTKDARQMSQKFLESLKMYVEYDGANIFLYDKQTDGFIVKHSVNCSTSGILTLEQMGIPEMILGGVTSFAYNDTDMINNQIKCGKLLAPSMYLRNRFDHAIHIVMYYENVVIGVINLYRFIGNFNFNPNDLLICNMLKDHLAFRYNKEISNILKDKFTVSEVVTKYGLTPRETEVLKGMLDGKDNYDIGDEMAISVFTIKKHIMNIYKKLDICSRTQLFKKVKEFE